MPDANQLSERLSDLLEPSVEIDSEIAAVHGRHAEGIVLGRGRLAYTTSVDAAFAFADDVAPGWIVDHMGDDGSGLPGRMSRGGATCELTDGRREVQGQSFNRASSIVAAALKVVALVESEAVPVG